MPSIGVITGDLKKNQTGMATYTYNILEGIRDQYQITQIMDKSGDLLNGFQSITPKTLPISFNYLSWSLSLSLQKSIFSKFDLIHNMCQYPVNPSVKRSIITIFDLIPILYPELVTPVYAWQSKHLLPRVLKKSSRILAISEHTKQDIVKRYHISPDKIDVTHLGVSDHFRQHEQEEVHTFKEQNNLQDPYILFVGALEPKKNVPSIIKAFSICHKQLPHLKLVIAGKSSWKYQEIFLLIKELDLEKSIRILNFVQYQNLPLLYSGAEVFIFPSLYEGFGLPPLEAMKCGTPVIVSNRSSLPEIVGEHGLMVDPGDINELSRQILKVILDKDFKAYLMDYYLKRAHLFTWDRCVRKTMNSYEKALNE